MSVVTRIRTSQELTVPFTPEEVWGVLEDVAAYPDWWPARLGVRILHDPGELLGAEFEVQPLMGRMFRIRFEELEEQRSMRLRFFGGSLEGPGGFHLHDLDGATVVRYEMDVFARGLDIAALSLILPPELIHRSRMRGVLRSLAGRLKTVRKPAERAALAPEGEGAIPIQAEEDTAHRAAVESARRRAEAETAARLAAEEAERRVAEEQAARRAAEEEGAASGFSGDVDHVEPGRASTGSRLRPIWGRIVNWLSDAEPTPSGPAAESLEQPSPNPGVSNFDIARFYLEALSSRATPEEIGQFFATQATDEEFPHRFLDTAVTRGLAGILEARAGALTRFSSQRYELLGATGGGSQVAMEVRWKGSVAKTGEGLTEGQELDARIALFLKFADRKIVRQRTYACFEPWSTRAERMVTLDERVAQAGQSAQAPAQGPGHAPVEPKGPNFEIARSYLDALGARADAETTARFYAADAVQDEFPNPFLPQGAHRDLQAIKLARTRGLALMASESYDLVGATGGGSQVALEVAWSGVVGQGMGLFTTTQKLEKRTAIFLKFRDGLIVSQRNY